MVSDCRLNLILYTDVLNYALVAPLLGQSPKQYFTEPLQNAHPSPSHVHILSMF